MGTPTGSFGPAMNFAVGHQPVSVPIGDLDADGKLDLAVANFGSDTVSILHGTGNGSFWAATSFAVGHLPESVAIGDLNGDGQLDIAVANRGHNNVSILFRDYYGGSFKAARNFAVGIAPVSVAIGDLNGDGQPDLAVANSLSGNVSILLNSDSGDEAFSPATHFAVGGNPYSVAIGDLNRDGKLDLAVANGANVSILLGTGVGAFGPTANYAAGFIPRAIAIGDLNGDGRPDLTVANDGDVSVLLNGPTPAQAIDNLIALIGSMGGQPNRVKIQVGPLYAASAVLTDGNPNNDSAACGQLSAFINQVHAKSHSGQLTLDQARQLLQAAYAIMDSLGCP